MYKHVLYVYSTMSASPSPLLLRVAVDCCTRVSALRKSGGALPAGWPSGCWFSPSLLLRSCRSPRATWTTESTAAAPRSSSLFSPPDGQHQRYRRLCRSAPQACFNRFVQLIIAVITFLDSFFPLPTHLFFFFNLSGEVAKAETPLSLLSLLKGSFYFVSAKVPCECVCVCVFNSFFLMISIHLGLFSPPSSWKCVPISIIHAA